MNTQSNINRFLEFNTGTILDLSSIIKIDTTFGDPNWLRYNVSLSTGEIIEIYENKISELYLPREKLLEALKKYYGINWLQK